MKKFITYWVASSQPDVLSGLAYFEYDKEVIRFNLPNIQHYFSLCHIIEELKNEARREQLDFINHKLKKLLAEIE
jgi:hypothetical protein